MQSIFSKPLLRVLGIILLSCSLFSNRAHAQGSYFEWYNSYSGTNLGITGGLGFSVLYGDLAKPQVSNLAQGLQFNLGVSYRLTNYVSVRGEGTLYRLYLERPTGPTISGALPKGAPNLSTLGWNGSVLLVHDFVSRTAIDRGQKSLNAYVLGGAGLTYFVPKNADDGTLLRDVQRHANYAKVASTYTLGGGIEFFPVSYISIGLEAQYIITSTDLLDDSKPGSELNTANDSFFFTGVKMSYQIGGAKKGGSVSGFNYSSYLKKSKKRAKYK